MNSLTPERRVDVNGRVVTRHVRNGSSPAPQMTSAPTPPKVLSDTQRSLGNIAYNTFTGYAEMRGYSPIHGVVVNIDRKQVTDYVGSLPEEIAGQCLTQILDSETDRGYVSLLLSAINRHEDQNMLSDMTFLYNPDHEVVAYEEWSREFVIADNHAYLRAMVNGIRSYEKWGLVLPERFTLASKEMQGAVSALYETTGFVYFRSDRAVPEEVAFEREPSGELKSFSLTDRMLVETVVSHHDRLEEITSLIQTRGSSGKLLSDYFASHPPLRNGIL
jgi:hypothetical protein